MKGTMILWAVLISALCTFLLRAIPFLAFRGNRNMPEWLERLSRLLPPAIMAVLIVYCLKDIAGGSLMAGLAQILAVAVVAASYKWKHNTLCSIALGTLCYMVLLQLMG